MSWLLGLESRHSLGAGTSMASLSRAVTRGHAAVLHAHGATVPPTLTRGVAGARCACERGVTGGGVAASSSRRPEKVVTSGSSPSAGSGLLVSWSPSEGHWPAGPHCHSTVTPAYCTIGIHQSLDRIPSFHQNTFFNFPRLSIPNLSFFSISV